MNKILFIAEVSSNHHRDLDRFLQLFDKATSIGCDVVDLSSRWLLKDREMDVCLIQEK
jgi:sialic acid synthase SpsE